MSVLIVTFNVSPLANPSLAFLTRSNSLSNVLLTHDPSLLRVHLYLQCTVSVHTDLLPSQVFASLFLCSRACLDATGETLKLPRI